MLFGGKGGLGLIGGAALLIPGLALAVEPVAGTALVPVSSEVPAAGAPVAPVPRTAMAAALAAAGVTDTAVAAFYAARSDVPFWLAGTGWDDALLAAIDSADGHGLPPARYGADRLRSLKAAGGLAAEAAFMKAWLDLAGDLDAGFLDPRSIDRQELFLEPARPAPAALLARLSGPAPANFDHLAPQTAEYAQLRAELGRIAALAAAEARLAPVPAGRSIRPGERSERVVLVRERLNALRASGFVLGPDGSALRAPVLPEGDAATYDATLAAAIADYQRQLSLDADGIVGAQTVRSLNASVTDRHGQILVNLERIRWLHRDLSERHIFVNQANFTMELIEDGAVRLESRVVVGRADRFHTPEFTEMMTHLVVNPTWHVPVSIATKEILPKLQSDPTYAERNGYRIIPVGDEPVPDGVTSDYTQYSTGYFPFRIKQNPSEANALGLVKFMFPNQHAVYLHDTPLKKLFGRDTRAFSHGCVRVQRAFELAHALLEGQVGNPQEAFDGWLRTRRERRVDLDRPVRVYLTYRTVFLDREGKIQYRDDIYGRDRKMIAAMEAAGVPVLR